MKKVLFYSSIILLTIVSITACVKQKFDTPPDTTNIDPNLPVNSSIWALKQKWVSQPVLIEDDITIAGVVVADDRSGNFYKQIIIQDSSSGIVVLLGRSNLYNDYPIGRKIYIKCKGLYLGAYNKFIQLGSTPDNTNSISDIPNAKISTYITKGPYTPDAIQPTKITINQLLTITPKLVGTLIQIDSAEFESSIVGLPYAQDPAIASGTDRKIEDCAGMQIVVRNSGYASFKSALLPAGKGSIKAIYSLYNSTAQLLIRDTTDINMTATRCSGNLNKVDIRTIRNMFPANTIVPNEIKIKGIVISDKSAGNIQANNIVVQDETGGVVVRFNTSTGLPKLGDEIEVNISAQTLSEYNGLLQISTLTTAKFTKISTGNIVPRLATIAQVNDSLEVWESTLVQINNVTFPAGIFYDASGNKGNVLISDGTASITHYTTKDASFILTSLPTGSKTITGILGQYNNTKQISIRNLNDIQ